MPSDDFLPFLLKSIVLGLLILLCVFCICAGMGVELGKVQANVIGALCGAVGVGWMALIDRK